MAGDSTSLDHLVVGIDSCCLDVLEPMLDDLPTLSRLVESGASGPLTSQIPPWTPSAWPSLYTGTNPGKHGAFSFLSYDGYDWDLVDATDVREPTIWEILDGHGLTSVVVNAPTTHPPRPFDGALIPGYTAPENPTCHPEGLLEDVREAVGDYQLYGPPSGLDDPAPEYCELVRQRGEAFTYLADRFDPDFGFLEFQQPDTVFHRYPGNLESVQAIYEAVDAAIASVLAATDPDTVFVVSDHGMGEMDGHTFHVNEFLVEEGYAVVTRDGQGMPSWRPIRQERLRNGKDGRDDPSVVSEAVSTLASYGLTTERIGNLLGTVGLREFAESHVSSNVVRASGRQVDFAASQAYMRGRVELGVRINLEGREPDGIVPPDEYDALRERLIDDLSSVTTPDGKPVFDEVAPREEYFEGPVDEEAVDIVTIPREFDNLLSASLDGQQFAPPNQPWNHKHDGIVAAHGEGIDPDASLEDAHLFDVAPTLLASMGLAPGDHMDGDVLPVVDDVETADYDRTSVEVADTDDAATDEVASRLSNLGYIE
ncbi:alkaline phosphatase family protein [Halobacteriales archaeon Cl-PHB]